MAKVSTKKEQSKSEDFKALGVDKLRTRLSELQQDLLDFRRSLAAGELANPLVIRHKRREIARLQTELTRQLKEADNV